MIKVSVMYPNKPGARFDQAYYLDKHMPMVKARMGSTLKFYAVDKGVAGGSPGDPAPFSLATQSTTSSEGSVRIPRKS